MEWSMAFMQPQSAQPSASYYGVDENEQHWLFGDNQLGDNQPLPAELSTLADGALQNLAEMISDDDLEVLTDLVETFLSEALRQIQAMQHALQADDIGRFFARPQHEIECRYLWRNAHGKAERSIGSNAGK